MFFLQLPQWISIIFLIGTSAFAVEISDAVDPNESWKLTHHTKQVAIYSRPHSGSSLEEFKAIGAQLTRRLTRFTAFVRAPAGLNIEHPNLRVVKGNVLDYASVESAGRLRPRS